MKKLFFITTLLIFSCNSKTLSEIEKGDDEVIILSYLKIENSSKKKIYNFLENYVDKVILVEPQSYGYGFYEYGDDILFIERFKNEGAIISHAKNVSEGGVLQEDYDEYNFCRRYRLDLWDPLSTSIDSRSHSAGFEPLIAAASVGIKWPYPLRVLSAFHLNQNRLRRETT